MGKSYDIAVIGGGPGGYTAALRAAELGKTTALIEADFLGGTCLNRGCIPSKTYLKHAEIIEKIEKAKDWGIEAGPLTLSLSKMKKRKDEVINRLRSGISFLLRQGKIDVYNGFGLIQEDGIIKVAIGSGEKELKAEKVIIATGSAPAVPKIPGLESVRFDTSDTIFDMEDIPEAVIIIGGGVIGVELAAIFAALKSDVTIIEAANRIVAAEDSEASEFLAKALKRKGVKIHTGVSIQNVVEVNGLKRIKCCDSNGNTTFFEAGTLLVSTGRRPNLSAIKEVKLAQNGPFIKVNDKLETSLPNIYAVGDVIGGWQLAHAASAEGAVAAVNAAGGNEKIDYKVMPRCIYTLPEVASVGLSEEEAQKQKMDVKVERFDFGGNGKALSDGEPEGFTKIIYEAKYGEIIGVIMAGPHVTELIAEASSFMYLEGTIAEAAKMIHPHPSISESFFEAAVKSASRLYKNNRADTKM